MVAASETWWKRRCGERLGRYVLGPAIGAGGAASVYMARLDGPHGFERLLAIKIVHEHLLQDRSFVDTFRDEANLAVLLSHPNIVHTYELGCEGAQIFIAMEYLRGKPLSLVYERAFAHDAPLDYELVAWVGARCAEALHYAHELHGDDDRPLKVVHRDISPDNIVITYEGDVKVIDFGIARAEKRTGTTALGTVKGKRRYMAPEYAMGGGFDHTLDLFALGASLYEVALGRPAFGSEDDLRTLERLFWGDVVDPLQLRADFPPTLAAVLRKAMSSEREQRHASGADMARELDAIAGLTASDARARLSTKMRTLFEKEIAIEASSIGSMRSTRMIKSDMDAASVQEVLSPAAQILSTVARTAPSRDGVGARTLLSFMAAGGALAVALLILRTGGLRPSREAAAHQLPRDQGSLAAEREIPPTDSVVTIDVAVDPPSASARILLGDQAFDPHQPSLQVVRSDAPLALQIEAEGFQPWHSDVVPNRNRSLVVTLAPLAPANRNASARTEPAKTEPSKPSSSTAAIRSANRPAPGNSANAAKPVAREEQPPGIAQGVIRDNPFADQKP